MKRNILRVGDLVKIVEPHVFDRCGYPLNKDIIKNTMLTKDHDVKIRKFLKEFGIFESDPLSIYSPVVYVDTQDIVFNKVKDAIAYAFLKHKHHGGLERVIYTTYMEDYKGMIGRITKRKTVNTGRYSPGGGTFEDYEPAYLTGQQTHVIFEVSNILSKFYLEPKWFEKIHLEKYENRT